MRFDFTSPDADMAARTATGAAGSIQDYLRKPLWSPWVSLGVWFILTISVFVLTTMFAYVGGQIGWNVEQHTRPVGFGLGVLGLIVVGLAYDRRMVIACMGWNLLATILLGILVSG